MIGKTKRKLSINDKESVKLKKGIIKFEDYFLTNTGSI